MESDIRNRRAIVHFGRLLHERGNVAATDGNLSVRLDEQSILITPTCISKGMMRPQDLVVVDGNGRTLAGRRNVSSEIAMHLLIYKMRTDVNATRPFSCFPTCPQYWRVTPTEWVPFFPQPVSSTIQAPIGPLCSIGGRT
jgi:ribulose-5-phosphate 4-epimerase/fuculose-1-phosphate aldolase